jgi:NAD(P)-dependent dehydrogenase (short-subunit alcohol dehydrogenase family)
MMRSMPKPFALVTGASTGIGRATADLLAERGFAVLGSVRTDADAAALSSENHITPVRFDVTSEDEIRRGASEVADLVGSQGLGGLVNNAGVAVSGPLEFVSIAEIRRQLEVNLVGAIAVTQAFLPLVRRARGRLVNVSSISGRVAVPLLGPYAMSKWALEAASDALRRELSPFGIHVSVVEPGAIKTPIWKKGTDTAEERTAKMPPGVKELYGERMEWLQERAREMGETAAPAEAVARAIHHALTAARPRTRYLVGRDAKLLARLAWLLPDRTLDALLARRIRP